MRRLQILAGLAIFALFSYVVLHDFETRESITFGVLVVRLVETGLLGCGVLALAILGIEARERARLRSYLMYDDVRAHAKRDVWTNRTTGTMMQLSSEIERQFRAWELTEFQRELVINILRGFGDGEIRNLMDLKVHELDAAYLELSKRTGLHSREQFAPFFFGSLFEPSDEETARKNPFHVVSSQEPL